MPGSGALRIARGENPISPRSLQDHVLLFVNAPSLRCFMERLMSRVIGDVSQLILSDFGITTAAVVASTIPLLPLLLRGLRWGVGCTHDEMPMASMSSRDIGHDSDAMCEKRSN